MNEIIIIPLSDRGMFLIREFLRGYMTMPVIKVKKRSAIVTVFLPTSIFLLVFIGTPIVLYHLISDAGGGTVALGLFLGLVLGLVVSVITYRKVYALSDLMEEKLFLRGTMLIQQSGRREKAIDFSKEHISEIDAGISSTGLPLLSIEIKEGKNRLRIVGMNYSRQRAVQKFRDERFIGNFPIAPYEGLSAHEVDAQNLDAAAFVDQMLSLLWKYRNLNKAYQYHNSLPWDDEIKPQISAVRVIQGEEAYRNNLSLIEHIKNSSLYTVEESYNYLFISRDYLMVCPSGKIDVKFKTRIIPLGIFPMQFKSGFRSSLDGSDPWEYIEIRGVDESGNPHVETVGFSIYFMEEYYKAKIMKRYLIGRNLVQEK